MDKIECPMCYEKRDFYRQAEMAGAVCGWSYCKYAKEWLYLLLYWPVTFIVGIISQVMSLSRLGHWSGFRTETKGRHWFYRSHNSRHSKAEMDNLRKLKDRLPLGFKIEVWVYKDRIKEPEVIYI